MKNRCEIARLMETLQSLAGCLGDGLHLAAVEGKQTRAGAHTDLRRDIEESQRVLTEIRSALAGEFPADCGQAGCAHCQDLGEGIQ